nr:N-acetyltransferase [Aquimarina sp. AU474]
MAKKDWSLLPLTNNMDHSKKRFEFHVENAIAFIEYILAKENSIYLTHTEVPKSLERKGLGSAIIKKL